VERRSKTPTPVGQSSFLSEAARRRTLTVSWRAQRLFLNRRRYRLFGDLINVRGIKRIPRGQNVRKEFLCLKTTIPSDLHCPLLTLSTFFRFLAESYPSPLRRVSTPSVLRNFRLPPSLRTLESFCSPKLPSAATLAGFGFLLFLQASVGRRPCEHWLSSVSSNFSFRTEVSRSVRCLLRSVGLPANREISISTSRDRDLVVANQARVILSQDIFMSTKKFTFMKKNFNEKFLCVKNSN
jgi:hypothetical protein